MTVERADLRVVDRDYSGRPMGRLEACLLWLLDKLVNRSGRYEDGRPVPTWKQLRSGRA